MSHFHYMYSVSGSFPRSHHIFLKPTLAKWHHTVCQTTSMSAKILVMCTVNFTFLSKLHWCVSGFRDIINTYCYWKQWNTTIKLTPKEFKREKPGPLFDPCVTLWAWRTFWWSCMEGQLLYLWIWCTHSEQSAQIIFAFNTAR